MKLIEIFNRFKSNILGFETKPTDLSVMAIKKQLRAEGYTDPDIIGFEVERKLGLLIEGPFDGNL